MRKYTLLCIGFVWCLAVLGQDDLPTGAIEDAQIIIEKDKPLTLPRATRVFMKSQVKPVTEDTISLRYSLSEPHISLETLPFVPQVKTYAPEMNDSGQQNYVKFGFGNYTSPLLQAYGGLALNEFTSVGAYVFHQSFAKGPVRDEESAYSDSKISLMGQIQNEEWFVHPMVEFERETFYYYGRSDESISEIDDKVGLNHLRISSPVFYNPSEELSFVCTPTFYALAMQADGEAFNKDNGVDLDLSGHYQVNDELALYGALVFSNWKYTSGMNSGRNVFRINPGVWYTNAPWSVKAGVRLAIGQDDSTSTVAVYPDLAVDYSISDELGVFVEASGDLSVTNLNELRLQNRYLSDSLVLLNKNNQIDLKVGVRYAIRSDLTLEPFIQYRYTDNQPLFYHALADSSRFALAYDGLGTTNFGVTARLINKKSVLIGQMYISSYTTEEAAEAWYLPTTQFKVNYQQFLTSKLSAQAGLIILQGIRTPLPSGGSSDEELPVLADMSLEASYQLNDQWSGFVQVQNLFGVNYERYLNYPVRGFTGKLGVIWRF